MPVIIVAEGGRTWPAGPGADPCDGICGPEDVHAWGRRLQQEVNIGDSVLTILSPGAQWLGPAAQALAGEIDTWQNGARDDADTAFYDTGPGAAYALARGGFIQIIGDLAASIEEGMALNNRARVMAFEAGQGPEPEPTPTTEPPEEDNSGGFMVVALGVGIAAGALIYMRSRKK